ncbi:hypothetical protein MHK_004137 [Candidatus Magnetomorum sp. HK-1]|nr:hypothetical protein MHK_004137 [Candidatus Magnetomorum sp. HK-1]
MIISKKSKKYFKSLGSRVLQSMVKYQSKTPYFYKDDIFFNQYECLRSVWADNLSIKSACENFNISRSSFYETEKRFLTYGLLGLFSFSESCQQHPDLEQLTLLIKKARPSLSYTSIYRITDSVPLTKKLSSTKIISSILQSYGYGISDMGEDVDFWGRIQRTLDIWSTLTKKLSVSVTQENENLLF